ncbi:unnamed protein product [Medioppia subpectinata]|uniref:NR LBD domain-containing protein n=1 Tax=Medioppia subpectinata TaxID=1979941 RepID=A0A7R9KML8_9ACAR|nr:unnamed protein product [Medioppia subpectinata]CAG2106309.1 unnamed protein product [Medioppia subpectinata]
MKKCFDLGMKKEWILNDEQKNIRRNKIEENRRKRKNSTRDDGDNRSSDSSANHSSPATDTSSPTNFTNQIEKIQRKERDQKQAIMPYNTIPEAVYEKTAELEMSVIPIARPISDLIDKFNDLEMNRLAELLNAMHMLKSPLVPITSEAMTMDDGCNVWRYKCEQEVLKIIKMSKSLEAFQGLCENDQIALVKYGCIEMHCLRLTLHYDFDKEYWTLITDNCQSTVLKMELLRQNKQFLYNTYKAFFEKLKPEWESDSIILDILTAIILFNPDRPNLLFREMVKLQQHIYMYLLQRYLLMRYPTDYESKTKFMRLMSALIDLNIVRESHVIACMELEKDKLSPLMREICDYNNVSADSFNHAFNGSPVQKTREERKLCQNHTKEISNEVSVIHIPDSTADLDATKRLQIENYIKDQAEYGPTYGMPFTPILSDITLRYNFNDMEYKRFNELLMAADVMKAVAREPTARIESVGEAQAVMRSVLERDIRNVIKFTKSLHGFGSLCDGDQICLIKSGCIELIYMRSVLAFNYHNQSWNLFVDDNTSVILELDLLKSGASDIYGAHKKYLQHMGRHWHEDTTIVDLVL